MEKTLNPNARKCYRTIQPSLETGPMKKASYEKKAWRYYSITQLSTSICLSVCGWYAELIRSWVPLSRKSSFQKRLMNRGSRSETKLLGIPWSFLTMSIKSTTTECEVWWVGSMPRWMPFNKRSTTTKMVMRPWYTGRPTIKSRERSSHG